MLATETPESYRRMTPSQRLELTLSMMDESEPYLLAGTKEQVACKFQRLNDENTKRNLAMLTQLAHSQRRANE